jgi:hypothetical protein
MSWSPDGRKITVVDFKSNTSQDAYLLDVESGEAEHLTPRDEDVRFFPASWAADGSGFYVLTDEGREYIGLAFYDLGAAELPLGRDAGLGCRAGGGLEGWPLSRLGP